MFTQIHDTQLEATAITKEAGFIIAAGDINQAQSVISEEELKGVAGGFGGAGGFLGRRRGSLGAGGDA